MSRVFRYKSPLSSYHFPPLQYYRWKTVFEVCKTARSKYDLLLLLCQHYIKYFMAMADIQVCTMHCLCNITEMINDFISYMSNAIWFYYHWYCFCVCKCSTFYPLYISSTILFVIISCIYTNKWRNKDVWICQTKGVFFFIIDPNLTGATINQQFISWFVRFYYKNSYQIITTLLLATVDNLPLLLYKIGLKNMVRRGRFQTAAAHRYIQQSANHTHNSWDMILMAQFKTAVSPVS